MRLMRLALVRALNVALMLAAALMAGAVFIDVKIMKEGYLFDKTPTDLVETEERAEPPGVASTPAIRPKPRIGDYSNIFESDAFASNEKLSFLDVKPPAVAVNRPVGAAESPFALLGTVVSGEGDSYAILEQKFTRRQEVVRQGGVVQGIGQLSRIEKDSVVVVGPLGEVTFVMPHLDGNYARAAVRQEPMETYVSPVAPVESGPELNQFNEPGMPGGPPGMPMPPGLRPERMRDAPAVFTPPPPRPAGAPSSMLGENELAYLLVEAVTVIDDAALRERLIAGVIEPVFVGFAADRSGAVYSGFLVGDAGEWSLGELLGLRRGDLVIKANAAVLDGPGKWTEFIETISMDRKLDMDVLRDGRIEKLHYEVR